MNDSTKSQHLSKNAVNSKRYVERGYVCLGKIPLSLSYGDKTLQEDLESKDFAIKGLCSEIEGLKNQIEELRAIISKISFSAEIISIKAELDRLKIELAALRSEVAGV